MSETQIRNDLFYEMIFKRKSFHLSRGEKDKISQKELGEIEETFKKIKPLIADIKVDMKIVPASQTNCKRGEEYCILLYSEKKDNYLQNIGYMGEQLDLYLASVNIGALWFGIGKIEESKYNDLDFIIMIAISKMSESNFRVDMFRFAPSSCNTQPWMVEIKEDQFKVYRYKKSGKRGIMPIDKVNYYNKIDIGIFLLFLEICLKKEKIAFNREISIDQYNDETEKILNATYQLKSLQ